MTASIKQAAPGSLSPPHGEAVETESVARLSATRFVACACRARAKRGRAPPQRPLDARAPQAGASARRSADAHQALVVEVAHAALNHDVVLAPGNVFSVSQNASRYMRFNVAQMGEPRIFEVLARALAATPD